MAEALDPALPRALDTLAKQVLQEACDRNLMLVTAESCTGGLLASLLTDIPGSSHAFDRGFVTYTDESKHELLGVPMEVLAEHTAVSRPTAIAMAEGAIRRAQNGVAIAITGYAEGSEKRGTEAGLVHFASARTGRPVVHREEHFGDIGRAAVRIACLDVALNMMLARLNGRD
ncbi:MAG TPA: CinA family protein [Caulobacteraceae bacterium]|nr:CinA family protein [Caulobacteraceae bacterium]